MKKTIRSIFATLLTVIDSIILRPYPSDIFQPSRKASVKFSALMTGIKGKIGGTVFQSSSTGFMIRNKPSGNFVKSISWVFGRSYTQSAWGEDYATLLDLAPGQLASDGSNTNLSASFSAQQLIRKLSKAWGALDSSDRDAWAAAAASFPFTNKWGEQYTGTGFQVFISINSKLIPYEIAMQTLPPSASDGTLPDHTWNTIFLEPESSNAKYLQLEVPNGIAAGAAVIVSMYPAQSAGRLKIAFGGKGQIALKQTPPATYELLPLFELLFGPTYIESVVTVNVTVINLSNGHNLYTSTFQQKILPVLPAGILQFTQENNFSPPPSLSLALELDWITSVPAPDLGSHPIGYEGDTVGYLIRLLQLTANESITFSVGGATPSQFGFFLAGTEIITGTPLVVNANGYGTYGNQPLGFAFHPDSLGNKSATLTITAASLPAPVIITVVGICI